MQAVSIVVSAAGGHKDQDASIEFKNGNSG
jgi:hypothetical protein